MVTNQILYVFACAGYGTRLNQAISPYLPKAISLIDEGRGLTPLEYHLRMLMPGAQIGIIGGKQKPLIEDYLKKHKFFGHDLQNFYWIPSKYQASQVIKGIRKESGPDFPYGSAAWLIFEEDFIKRLQKKGVSIIVQTGGNKVGERWVIIKEMIEKLQNSTAEWIAAVYNDVKEQLANMPEWHKRFDILVDGKGIPKGYAFSEGDIVADWYVFKISSISRLWKPDVRESIQQKAAQYSQERNLYINDEILSLRIVEINMPLLLEYFQLETFEVSRNRADLGFGLKTASDRIKCRDIFERREREGLLRER